MAKVITIHKVKEYKCPICDSSNILFKKQEGHYWCRRCGSEFGLNVSKKGKWKE